MEGKIIHHPVFDKYRRDWLHRVTGYSKGVLCRVATGRTPPSRAFIERVAHKLNEAEDQLFSLDCAPQTLGQWAAERRQKEHLSLRQAAAKAGLSHATIGNLSSSKNPSIETIKKLAQGFTNGHNEKLALEDHLLVLARYRGERPEGEELTGPRARVLDKVDKLNEPQLKIMEHFADFLVAIEGERNATP